MQKFFEKNLNQMEIIFTDALRPNPPALHPNQPWHSANAGKMEERGIRHMSTGALRKSGCFAHW